MKKNYPTRQSHFSVRWLPALLLLVASIAATSVSSYAQSTQPVEVAGKVTDETGTGMPGVNVLEKGTSNGVVTDVNGNYKLLVLGNDATLIFSFVGTVTQEVRINNRTEVNTQMEVDTKTLSEIVVVGYGTQESKDVTGSVASIKSDNFNKGIINSPEQLLQGKVAGVNVVSASGEPGANQAITIRGPGSIRTGSTPLFVVDGMALDNTSTSSGGVNPLNFINPQDIASMHVLKDASATAIYGSRGANGVIIITTKKGNADTSFITYSMDYGVSSLARPIDVFSANEFRKNVVAVGGTLDDQGANTDWQKEVTRSAITQNHNISFGGGANKLSYYASLGVQDQEGILKNSGMKRYTGRINVTQKSLNDRLTVEMNLNASNTVNERSNIESIIGGALSMNPTYPAYDQNGKPAFLNLVTPLVDLDLSKDVITTNRIIGNITPTFEIIKGLVYKLNLGIDYATATRDIQSFPILQPTRPGRVDIINKNNINSLIENYITYTFSKTNHNLTVLVGHSYQRFNVQERGFSINNFAVSDVDPANNPSLGSSLNLTDNRPSGSTIRNELQSVFGRATYEWKGKYLATATFRADGSTKFGKDNKYGYFPSFSLGWRISEEPFLKSLPISNLKLRLGWGQTGNQDIPEKKTLASFNTSTSAGSTYPLATGPYPAGTTYSRLANPGLQWEVSTQTDIGLDFGFLDGALSGSVDYFHKKTDNILLRLLATADPVQVASETWANLKDMTITNQGVEIALDYQFKRSNDFRFNVGGNVTFIDNKVKNSPYTVIPSGSATGSGLTSATINGYVNDQPIGTFFLKEFNGFDQNGLSKYVDHDGDGVVTDKDRIAAGTALPSTMFNFYGTIGYKNFDLTFNFNGVSGNKVYDNTANANFYKLRVRNNLNATNDAIANTEESPTNAAAVSTRYLKDAAFLRLNNLTLGYNFNTTSLHINQWVKAIRLSVTGQNLFVITKYDGFDPEVNKEDRTIDGASSYGIDYLSYPKATSVIVGLNVTF
ncbi:MAG: SusC/RagA family TonB-linked outer membrane protein [Cyclobacteriaceae bacterium]|jgi:TonB-linked SusC/RagA family outer membrane protein|nr:TonB-dependent receptor [Flammeovirgaceae bacterium]